MKYLGFALLLIFAISCKNAGHNRSGGSSSDTPTLIPAEQIDATADQIARRRRSEAICLSHGVPIYKNPHALFPDPENEVVIRTKDSVVDRAIALLYISLKGLGEKQKVLDSLGKAWHIMNKLSPAERTYVLAAHPTKQQHNNASWKTEDFHVLLWALQLVDTLDYPNHQCHVGEDGKLIPNLDISRLLLKARLRPQREILDQADLILRLDWACVDARTNNHPAPGGLDPEVVLERHYALNWLICYLNEEWDDVGTDT